MCYSQIETARRASYHPRMDLQLRIRQLRTERGMTLAELADMVGVSVPHLSGVERGKKNLNNHLIVRLSDALEVEPYELFDGDSQGHIRNVLAAVSRLPEEDRMRVEAFALALLSSQSED